MMMHPPAGARRLRAEGASARPRRSSQEAWRAEAGGFSRAVTKTMLTVNTLRKTFGSLVAVDDVTFSIERGQLVGLLGPNGAGKTTTVSIIAGLLSPDR